MRVVFMGSPDFAVPTLKKLVLGGYEVVAVYTQPDRLAGRGRALGPPPVKTAALEMGLRVLQPESIRTEAAIGGMAALKSDVIVVCAYGQILPKALLDIPPCRCLNVHFSLLPRHRGASPVAAAILAGDEFTGVSIMIVALGLDTGPVLARAAVPIAAWDNTGTLTGKLAVIGSGLLLEALGGWRRGEIEPAAQIDEESTYFSQIKKEDGEIDWTLPAEEIGRRVRAFNPWPGCYTAWRGKKLRIIEAVSESDEKSLEAGVVIALPGRDGGLGIGTGAGVLRVLALQIEGRRAVGTAEFHRGQRDFIGAKLPC